MRAVFFCVLLLTDVFMQALSACPNTAMDLVFAIDSSASMTPKEFEKEKQFLAVLLKDFNVGQQHVRVGLVRFSQAADVIANLDESNSLEEIFQFIIKTAYKQGATNTYAALNLIRENVLAVSRGNRPDAPDVVMVITDGESLDRKKTLSEAALLKGQGVSIVSLGVGTKLSRDELEGMSSGLFFNVSDFNDLQDLGVVNAFRGHICTAAASAANLAGKSTSKLEQSSTALTPTSATETTMTSTAPTTAVIQETSSTIAAYQTSDEDSTVLKMATDQEGFSAVKTGCGDVQMNLVFVLDSSYSVSDVNFQLAKSFITDIVQSLPVGETQVRVGLVRYGNSADVIYALHQPADVKSVTGAIESMQHVKGSTNTASALATLRLEVLTPEVARLDLRTVVAVITDGESDSRQLTKAQARKLREQNVRLIWVYIGGNDNSALRIESRTMQKEGDAIFMIDNFNGLGDELQLQILGASCKEDETTPALSKAETTVPVTTSTTTLASATTSTTTLAPATTSTTTTAPITTTTPTTTLTSTAATATTAQQDTTTTLPHTELASTTTGVPIESSTLSEAPAAVSFSKETTVTQSLTTQETPKSSNTTTLAPAVSTPSVASTESTAQIHAQATDANATQNRTDKPEADHSVSAVTAGDRVSEGESAHSTYDGSTNQGSWQQDWMMSAGISAGVVALVAVASGLGYVALRRWRWKQRRNKSGHHL